MAAYKHIDKICCAMLAVVLVVTVVFLQGEQLGITAASHTMGYEDQLFDTSRVHTLDITMEDWDGFLETCTNEEYSSCTVTIDQEEYANVAIRAKGNTSLQNVAASGGDRYSFKIEFDHYDDSITYHGLDKLCLNNIIQDNTYLKDYLCYRMMAEAGAAAPLCSFVYITVNGEDWGLYLAVEAVEESFLERNYGSDYGELYKPDSTQMGGGPKERQTEDSSDQREQMQPPALPQEEAVIGESGSDSVQMPQRPEGGGMGGGRSMGSSDVSLIYTDDDPDSYSNIFENAKTDISDADQQRLIEALQRLGEGEDLENTVDIEAVIRYFVAHNFVCNFDSYTGSMIHNYYLYEEDGVLSMIPWDYNLAFGGFVGGSDATSLVNYPIDTPVSGGTVDSRPMLAWIFQDESYTQLYHSIFQQFLTEYFSSGAFELELEQVVQMITPYVEKDPTKFCTVEEFETAVDALRSFCQLRAESVQGQLDGTIPSTQEGQQADPDSLVDASDLSISDMGSMSMGGGRGGMDHAFPGQRNQETTADTSGEAETASPPVESTDTVSENSSEQTQQRPSGMRNPNAETTDSASADHFAAEGQQPDTAAQNFAQPPEPPSGEMPGEGTEGEETAVSSQTDDFVAEGGSAQPDTESRDFAQPPELPFGEMPGEGTEGEATAVSSQTDDSVAEGGSAQPGTEAQNFAQPPEPPSGEMPEQGSETESATASADNSSEQPAEESAQSASGAGETEDSRFSRGNGGMPPWGQSSVEETASTSTIVALLGGSVLVLVVGLGIAWRFRR